MLYPLHSYRSNRMSKISIHTLFCALSLLAILIPATAHAQTFPFSLTRNGSSAIALNPVLAGVGIVEDTILITDTSGSSNSVSVSISGNPDIGLDTDKFTIDTNKHYSFVVTFAPKSVGNDSTTLTFKFDGDSATLLLTAQGIDTTTDSSTLTLSNAANGIIAMEYQKDSALIHVFIKNDFSTEDTISSVTLADPTFFHILNPPTTSIPLPSKDSFEIILSFNATGSSTDFLKDELLLVSVPNDPIAPEIAIQGLYNPNDAVQTQPTQTTYFYLYPNPSQGPVTIHSQNISQTHVTITDVLGRTLTEASFTGDWQWDRSESGGMAPSGTYFVIVTGIGTNGEPVHEVKRMVLE
jgi:hypothetical protein